jgi:hypothetical protein
LRESVPECVQLGFVDLESGVLLELRTFDGDPKTAIELAARAAADLFHGEEACVVERLLSDRPALYRAMDTTQEILVSSNRFVHVFHRSKGNGEVVLLAVCRNSTDSTLLPRLRAAMVAVGDAAYRRRADGSAGTVPNPGTSQR